MKIVIVNGSPRKGNTLTAIEAFTEGLADKHEVEVIEADKVNVSPCRGCGACQCVNGCVAKDDSNAVVDKLVAADFILWTTPVYWWGVTAQLKLIIDKCYCKGAKMVGKKIATIVCGGAETTDMEYQLIRDQFGCISKYLNWDYKFQLSYYANAKDDLKGMPEALEEIKAAAASL